MEGRARRTALRQRDPGAIRALRRARRLPDRRALGRGADPASLGSDRADCDAVLALVPRVWTGALARASRPAGVLRRQALSEVPDAGRDGAHAAAAVPQPGAALAGRERLQVRARRRRAQRFGARRRSRPRDDGGAARQQRPLGRRHRTACGGARAEGRRDPRLPGGGHRVASRARRCPARPDGRRGDAVRRSRRRRRRVGKLEPMLFGGHMSSAGGIYTAIDRIEAIGGDCVQVFTQSPRMWKPTAHTPEAIERFKTRRAEVGLGGVVCHALYLVQPGGARRRDLREVDRRDARLDGGGERDRGRRGDLPRRLASRRRVRRRARAGRAGPEPDPRALRRRHVALHGELGRRRRHDRAVDRRARDARRRARPPSAARPLPRLVPSLRLGLRRHAIPSRSTRSSPRSTRRSGSTGCARCTSTTAPPRSARTATGTRTSSRARSAKGSARSSPTRRSRSSAPTSRSRARATGRRRPAREGARHPRRWTCKLTTLATCTTKGVTRRTAGGVSRT